MAEVTVHVRDPRHTRHEPPFDGEPCAACPTEVRNLLACVHNFMGAYTSNGPTSARTVRKFHDMRAAHELLQKVADEHFADKMHSHPTRG